MKEAKKDSIDIMIKLLQTMNKLDCLGDIVGMSRHGKIDSRGIMKMWMTVRIFDVDDLPCYHLEIQIRAPYYRSKRI